MLVLACIFAAAAALLHVFIFYLEVFAWRGVVARKIFGQQTAAELDITTFYAYNQGIYNLALAVIAGAGCIFLAVQQGVGIALLLAGCGSMVLAALGLGLKSPRHRAAAVKQGALPLLAVLFTFFAVAF